MRRLCTFLFVSFFLISTLGAHRVQAQEGAISGTITDAESGETLVGVNVRLEGTDMGTSSGQGGRYEIREISAGTYTLVASYIGYETKRVSVDVSEGETVTQDLTLALSTAKMGEVVVTGASGRAEKITESPATVEAVGSAELEQLPGFSYEQAFSRLKGVDMTRTGVTGVGVNARGFNSAFNASGLALTDGRRSVLPGNGLPFGNMNPVIKEDIDRMEVILGPSSALYGPNASNLVVNLITKDPREHEETIAVAEGGTGVNDASLYSGRVWHGQSVSDGRFGFKVFGEYTAGEDYNFVDTTYSGQTAIPENPDHDIGHIRGGTGLYYSPTETTDIVASYNVSQNNFVTANNVGHNQIKDWRIQVGHLRVSAPHFYAQVYGTWSNSGETYALNDAAVFQAAGMSREQAIEEARFISESSRYNAEAQYNNSVAGFEFILGANYQLSRPQSNGTFLSDTTGSALEFTRYGFSGQVERDFGPLKAVVASRLDVQDNYGAQFSPKAGLVYQTGVGNFRVTYGRAFVAPTPLQQELYIPAGNDPSSGLPIVIRGNADGFTLADGTTISPLDPEKVQTWEFGYKGALTEALYVDVNAYRSVQEDFVTPLQVIGVATQRGSVQQNPEIVLTYQNFGEVVPYGVDATVGYQFSNQLSIRGTYSYFDANLDKSTFDLNDDGTLTPNEISLNTPKHKGSVSLTARDLAETGIFGTATVRYVSEYDFISGVHYAADENEGTRPSTAYNFNYGPLGGFTTVNMNVGYRILPEVSLSVGARNLFNVEQREFVGSPSIGRMITTRLRTEF